MGVDRSQRGFQRRKPASPNQQHDPPQRRHPCPRPRRHRTPWCAVRRTESRRRLSLLPLAASRRNGAMTTNMPRVLCHMVLADFLERVRRYSFLLTLAFAVYVAYAAFTEKIVLRLDDYRGIYNSAWLGGLMGVVCSAFLSLVGFYVVKNSIQRDQQTRVGKVLAATPMTKRFYTFAKSISNFAVLAAMVLVMGAAAVVMQLLRGEDPHLHLWSLLAPLALFALPAMAFVAALAVLFETLPVLRGGIGNVIFFFLWILLLVGGGIGSLEKGAARNTIQYFEDFTGI